MPICEPCQESRHRMCQRDACECPRGCGAPQQQRRQLTEDQRALMTQALRDKAEGDRKAAHDCAACPMCQDRPGYNGLGNRCRTCAGTGYVAHIENVGIASLAKTLKQQADAADTLANLLDDAAGVQVIL